MLSSLPKLADKHFIIGFFLPALLLVLVATTIFPDVPGVGDLRKAVSSQKSLTDLTFLVLTVWVIGVALLITNHVQYRILEGYMPPFAWCSWLRRWHTERFKRLQALHDRLNGDWAKAIIAGRAYPPLQQARVTALKRRLVSEYPNSEMDILPTRFGNAIRAFEVYPRNVYGADAISVWLRLASVIPRDFQNIVNDARTQVDFLINITFASFLLAAATIVKLMVVARDGLTKNHINTAGVVYLGEIGLAFLIVSYVSYHWSIGRAATWGDLVKSAFDCYLPALAEQMGYAVPEDDRKRREFWTEISRLFLYQELPKGRWRRAHNSSSKAERRQKPRESRVRSENVEAAEERTAEENDETDNDDESEGSDDGDESQCISTRPYGPDWV